MTLTRHRSLRKSLRDRGQLSHFWKTHRLDMVQYSQDCAAFTETSEPLINYLDVSAGAPRGAESQHCVAYTPKAHYSFALLVPSAQILPSKLPPLPHTLQPLPGVPGLAPACSFVARNAMMAGDKEAHSWQALPALSQLSVLSGTQWGHSFPPKLHAPQKTPPQRTQSQRGKVFPRLFPFPRA